MESSTPPSGAARPTRDRDLLAWDRSDRIGLSLLLALVAVVSAGAWVVAPIVDWVGGRDLEVPFFSSVDVPGLAGTGLGHGSADYSLLLPDPSVRQRLLDLLPGLGYLAIVLVGAWLVLRVMTDIGRGDPFHPRNVRRLRIIGGLLAFGWPIVFFAELTCRFAILTGLDLGDLGPRAGFTIPVLPVIAGMVVALLAEAFKAGSRLRRDVEGLV